LHVTARPLGVRELGITTQAFALTGGFDAWIEAWGDVEPLGRAAASENAAHHQPM
jgi:hypothetical protein